MNITWSRWGPAVARFFTGGRVPLALRRTAPVLHTKMLMNKLAFSTKLGQPRMCVPSYDRKCRIMLL